MNETDVQIPSAIPSAEATEQASEVTPNASTADTAPAEEKGADELSVLQSELARLRTELEATRLENEQQKRMAAEVSEFCELFPDAPLSTVPDAVWDRVKGGIPLAAAFALYEKKSEAARLRAEAVNLQNAKRSAGAAGRDAPAEYLSPEEVRTMSPSEVRRNYTTILNSMKSWKR